MPQPYQSRSKLSSCLQGSLPDFEEMNCFQFIKSSIDKFLDHKVIQAYIVLVRYETIERMW